MKGLHRVAARVKELENLITPYVDPTVFVTVVRLWQPGLQEDAKGAVFMKNVCGPGLRFSNDEEADAWIREERKRLDLSEGVTTCIEKDQAVGMPWEEMPAYKKRLKELKEAMRQEKASLTQT